MLDSAQRRVLGIKNFAINNRADDIAEKVNLFYHEYIRLKRLQRLKLFSVLYTEKKWDYMTANFLAMDDGS